MNDLGQRTALNTDGSAFGIKLDLAWTYNARGELVTAANANASTQDRAYHYDAIGNRIESAQGTTALTGTANYQANALNQYTSLPGVAATPSYDDDGNAISYPVPTNATANATLEWDAENRLIKTIVPGGGTTTYFYDYLSRRISKTTGSTTTSYIYNGWNCIAEYQNNTLHKTYTCGTDLSGSMQGAGGVGGLLSVQHHFAAGDPSYYPTYDGNGNVSEYLDESGVNVAQFEYDPFGNVTTSSGTIEDFDIRFSTKKRDEETGLYYYGYRYYDPVTGRWPSRDPIGERGGLNIYGFANNSAVGNIDVMGNAVINVGGGLVSGNLNWTDQKETFTIALECHIPDCACSYEAEITWREASNGQQTFYANIGFNVTKKESGGDSCRADVLTSAGSISGQYADEETDLNNAEFLEAAEIGDQFVDQNPDSGFSVDDVMQQQLPELGDVTWLPNQVGEAASGASLGGVYTSFSVNLTHPIDCGSNNDIWVANLSK